MSTHPNWILHRQGLPARQKRWTREQVPRASSEAELLNLFEAELFESNPLLRQASKMLAIWD